MRVKQGDAYDVFVTLTDDDGTKISVGNNDAEMVELTMGRLRKTCPGEVVETPGNQWYGNGTVARRDIYGNYRGVQTIQGNGIIDKFTKGDVISVTLAAPNECPYVEHSTRPIRVIDTYRDELNNKEYLVTNAGPTRDYEEAIVTEVTMESWNTIFPGQYGAYFGIGKSGSGVGEDFDDGDVVDVISDYLNARRAIVQPNPSPTSSDTDYLWFLIEDFDIRPVPSGESPGDLTIITSQCDVDGFGPFTKFTQNMTIAAANGKYAFPLKQEETFQMSGVLPFEARIKFNDQEVVGTSLGTVVVEESASKEVL